ncbi:unnamed protein product [Blepharisma stoltei]|uniref:N-acetyltransferase domain-containing protein n=1 Tax=Blepharisma stoltei TaxID=1481888 RepID=A0AAU9K7B3_9CILI|nr:unnamed protein product [Blepharisma stoltei]
MQDIDSIPNIHIEEYTEEMEPRIFQLEKESAVSVASGFPSSLIKFCTIFHQNYSSRPKQFNNDYRILVAKDTVSGKLIGVINAVIKEAWYNENKIKFAQLFGLKVHEKYQRKGIATLLIRKMNVALKSLGVAIAYAKIESSNIKAWELFANKLQFADCYYQDTWIINPSLSIKLNQLSVEKAYEMTKNFYDKRDLCNTNLLEIFQSPHYIGTYIVETEKGYAGISLWDSSAYADTFISKVVIDTEKLKSNPIFYQFLWLLAFFSIVLALYYGYFLYFLIGEPILQQIYFLLGLIGLFKYGKSLYKIQKFAKIAINQKRSKKAKTFGFFYQCTEENRRNMLIELTEGLATEAHDHGLDFISFEMKSEDYFTKDFEIYEISGTKNYVQKSISDIELCPWMLHSFVDPRD